MYEEAQEEGRDLEIVYVSSDVTAEQCQVYMKETHGDWLRIPYDSPFRNSLKERYGVFPGKEQSLFPSITRRSGIPGLVVISRDGKEQVMLDCDDPKVIQEVEKKGTSFLDPWEQYKW